MNTKKIIFLLVGFIFGYALLPGQSFDSDSAVEVGYKKMNNKQFEKALEEFEKVLERENENFDAVIGRTSALLLLERERDASKYVEEGLEDYPGKPQLLYCQGLIHNYKEQYKKALKVFTEVIDSGNDDLASRAYISRGIAFQQMKDYQQAIGDFTLAIDLNEDNMNALYNRGFSYYKLGNYEDAINDFNEVIEEDKDNAYAFYNLGMAYFRSEKKLNACRYFQQACQLGNTNACKMVMTECVNQ